MNTKIIAASFRFLTPAFVHGVYQGRTENTPELRAPSIRGQLRWWWRTLGYGLGNEIFGSASGDTGAASKIQVRLIAPASFSTTTAQLLAHKEQGNKNAIAAKKDLFTVQLRPVRGGIAADQLSKLEKTLRAWLLMGGIGQRAGRGCGSPWPEEDAPMRGEDYLAKCRCLLKQSGNRIALLDQNFDSELAARQLAGRFLKDSPNGICVPGKVFGSASKRKSSSLKLRVVCFDVSYRLAALWVPKQPQDSTQNLQRAIEQMLNNPAKAELGALLQAALPELTP